MKRFPFFLMLVAILVGIVSCMRDDDEPIVQERRISRLYVSTSDYGGSSGNTYHNVFVIDPADSVEFPPENTTSIYEFTSAAKGGNFINFTPYSDGVLFQGSQNSPVYLDTAIQVMSVSPTGVISNTGRIANRKFSAVRGLAYTVITEGTSFVDDYLLSLDASGFLYAIRKPKNQGNFTKPYYYITLDYNPWGITVSDRDVFVTSFSNENKPNATNGIVVYKNLTSKFVSNLEEGAITEYLRFDLSIDGVNNVRGIAYSKVKDLLVVTDFSGDGADSKGKILMFENFSKHSSNTSITPDRIITSSSLKQPLDIAIDTRETGKYIYVADPIAKRVFRFNITDEGNVSPNTEINLFNRTPQSISLDAR